MEKELSLGNKTGSLNFSPRARMMRERYLSEPLYIDAEYIRYYTEAHKITDGMNPLMRRAECHAYSLENLTPVINEGELFVGSKTRYIRGAIPYCNYASSYILREFKNQESEAQDKFTDIGTGGGIAHARELAASGQYEFFCKKFLLTREDKFHLKNSA
ncbi:MAG: pyruvate formate lyase family protein, partial [Methanococcaceae archaeon]